MKITTQHFNTLKGLILKTIDDSHAPINDFAIAYKDKNLSDKRFMFDWFYAAPSIDRNPFMHEFYAYCDDTHLNTALKVIFKSIPTPSKIK